MQRSGWSQGAILLKRLVGPLAPEHRLSEPSIPLQISQGPTIRPLTTQSRHHSHQPCFAHSNPSVTSSDQHLESSPHLLPIDAHPCRFATSLHELLRRKPPESTRDHAVTLLFPPTYYFEHQTTPKFKRSIYRINYGYPWVSFVIFPRGP